MLLAIHILSVYLSLAGFIVRGILMMMDSPLLQSKIAKIFPHIVDTVLLVTAISLVIITHLYPTEQPWLMGKIVGLIAYIVIGTIALKRGKTKTIRIIAWLAALVIFMAILSMAMTRQLPF